MAALDEMMLGCRLIGSSWPQIAKRNGSAWIRAEELLPWIVESCELSRASPPVELRKLVVRIAGSCLYYYLSFSLKDKDGFDSVYDAKVWLKVGDSGEEVLRLKKVSDSGETSDIVLAQRVARERGPVVEDCRTCGEKGDHWTSRCPNKDLAMKAYVASTKY